MLTAYGDQFSCNRLLRLASSRLTRSLFEVSASSRLEILQIQKKDTHQLKDEFNMFIGIIVLFKVIILMDAEDS